MENCIYCQKKFEPKKPKAIYCSDKCRTYGNRKNKKLIPQEIFFVIDGNGTQTAITKSNLFKLLSQIDPTKLNS